MALGAVRNPEAGVFSLILSRPYRAVEPRLSAYLRRYLCEHHESCADWAPEISEAMFRQLILDGFIRTFLTCLFVIALTTASLAIRNTEENRISIAILLVVAAFFILATWRRLATQCVDREFLYRRKHGKWRWER
jgi:hypothetical protein